MFPDKESIYSNIQAVMHNMAKRAGKAVLNTTLEPVVREFILHQMIYSRLFYYLPPLVAAGIIGIQDVDQLEATLRDLTCCSPAGTHKQVAYSTFREFNGPLSTRIVESVVKRGLDVNKQVDAVIVKDVEKKVRDAGINATSLAVKLNTPMGNIHCKLLMSRVVQHRQRRVEHYPHATYCQVHSKFLSREHYSEC